MSLGNKNLIQDRCVFFNASLLHCAKENKAPTEPKSVTAWKQRNKNCNWLNDPADVHFPLYIPPT